MEKRYRAIRHPKTQHYYHIVDRSPWPFLLSCSLLLTAAGAARWFHFQGFGFPLLLGVCLSILNLVLWWRDVIREGTYEGHHTKVVQKGLRIGFILFILSEVMFFFSFFWAFFNSSLAPGIEIGCRWPPLLIKVFNPMEIPLLNTLILVLSGVTITFVHYALILGKRDECLKGFGLTLFLGFLFTGFQLMEYMEAPFSISDSVYGATFFMLTGFHGIHVLVGATFISVCFVRYIFFHFTRKHHLGFEFAAWYWHFVDVVWLFLYLILYCWGGYQPEIEII
jgi:cytochrome c oxidase subunit 3